MKLSFVIPAYNEENYVGKCIDAIQKEIGDRKDAEIIVSDNNSKDHTAEVAAGHPGVKVVHEAKKGANATREAGFRASDGELVAFIDADTEMPKGWVARAEKEFAKNPRLVCLSGPFIYFDLPPGIRVLVRLYYVLAYVLYTIARIVAGRTTVVQGGNYIVRRDALEKIGGHNTGITFYGDDTDLAVRMSKIGIVKFSFALPIRTSGRRLAKEGTFTMGFRYALNNVWMIIFRRPFSTSAEEVRFGAEGTIYKPEHAWKERFIAVGFTLLVIVFFGVLFFLIYLILKAIVLGAWSVAGLFRSG